MESAALLATAAAAAFGDRHVALNVRALTPSKPYRFPFDHRQIRRRRSDRRVRSCTPPIASEQETPVQLNNSSELELFSCPICYEPLIRKGPSGLNMSSIYRSGFKCQKCAKLFSSKDIYLDLTVTAGATEYNELKPARAQLFRSPLVSFLYERGWREHFSIYGFPGHDEEFEMAQDYFKPVAGGLLVDVSCGSGLFSRKFATSGAYSAVIASDFSENMLRQCYDYIKQDDALLTKNLALVRADVARLPFASDSVDAVHAGAALHCWPSPSNAVAEISRVLRSGGIFVASAIISDPLNTPSPSAFSMLLKQILAGGTAYCFSSHCDMTRDWGINWLFPDCFCKVGCFLTGFSFHERQGQRSRQFYEPNKEEIYVERLSFCSSLWLFPRQKYC